MPIILAQAAPPVLSAPAPARPSIITNPDWLRKPVGEDLAQLYPKGAAARNVEGRAVIHCLVNRLGALENCGVTDEAPLGEGFGDAALALSVKFKMRPQTRDGVPIDGGKINIPINFRLPRAMPSPMLALRCYGYAAAQAERDPASQSAQAGAFAFGLLIQAQLMPEHARPSEVAQVLASQRKIAATKLDDPAFQGERSECTAALPGAATASLQRMSSQLPH